MYTHALCTAAIPELYSIRDSTALHRRSPCKYKTRKQQMKRIQTNSYYTDRERGGLANKSKNKGTQAAADVTLGLCFSHCGLARLNGLLLGRECTIDDWQVSPSRGHQHKLFFRVTGWKHKLAASEFQMKKNMASTEKQLLNKSEVRNRPCKCRILLRFGTFAIFPSLRTQQVAPSLKFADLPNDVVWSCQAKYAQILQYFWSGKVPDQLSPADQSSRYREQLGPCDLSSRKPASKQVLKDMKFCSFTSQDWVKTAVSHTGWEFICRGQTHRLGFYVTFIKEKFLPPITYVC